MFYEGLVLEEKYRITHRIGEGSSGIIFQAVDTAGFRFAVKLMKRGTDANSADNVIRFKREAEILSRLKHPYIAEVQAWGEFEGRPYIVSSFLEGQSLEQMLAAGHDFNIDQSLHIVLQLAEGLSYLHSNGIIHRDLKPGNIIINPETGCHTWIIDFGMAYLKDMGDVYDTADIAGTLGYMSPEACGALNRVVDERSDLYSLGVIFYRLVTGKPPFEAGNINKVFYNPVSCSPVSPGKFNILATGAVEEIILKLLSKEPDMRYQGARGLIHDMIRVQEGDRSFVIGEKDRKRKLTYQTRLLGRECELQKLKLLFREVEQGKGGVCFVGGEAGIGKSRLVEELKEYVFERKGNFFKGRFADKQNKMPYKPFRDIVDQYISHTLRLPAEGLTSESERLKGFAGKLGELLIRFNPRMEKLTGDVEPAVHLALERENRRFLMVMSGLFYRVIGGEIPTVLYLDDLQWCDEGSMTLLEEILKNIKNSKILIIGTYRDNEITPGHPLSRITGDFGGTVSEIHLPPFTEFDANAFIAAILGEEQRHSEILSRYLLEKSGGNPFFMLSILRGLVDKGIIAWQPGGWKKDWAQIESIPYSENVLDLILKNSDKLGPEEEELLYVAAVAGKELDMDLLERITSLDRSKIISRVDNLIRLQFIEAGARKSNPAFSHDRIREVFYLRLDADKRKALHGGIAGILESRYDGNDDKLLFDMVHHYLEAGNDGSSLRFLIPAARKAKESYAVEEAFRYYGLALKLLEAKDPMHREQWLELKEGLAEVCLTMGKNTQAIGFLEEVLPFADSKMFKARIYRSIGSAYFKMGDWHNCEANIAKALRLLGEGFPSTGIKTTTSIIRQFLLHVLLYKLPFFKNISFNKSPELEREAIRCYLDLGITYIFNDSWKYLRLALRLRNLTVKSPRLSEERAVGLISYGAIYIIFSDFKKVLACFFEARDIREKLGNTWGVAQVTKFIAHAYSLRGDHEKSLEHLKLAGEMFEAMGDQGEWGDVQLITGNEFHNIANYAAGIPHYERYIKNSMDMKSAYGLATGYIGIANCYTEMGDFQRAQQMIDKVCAAGNKNDLANYNAYICKAGFEMERDNCGETIKIIEGLRDILDGSRYIKEMSVIADTHLLQAYLNMLEDLGVEINGNAENVSKIRSHCRKTLRESRKWVNRYGVALEGAAKFYFLTGKYKKAGRLFLESAEILTRTGMRYELGKCWFEYSKFLKHMGRESESREMMDRACEMFDRIGAEGWKERCRQVPDLKSHPAEEASVPDKPPFENIRYKVKLNKVIDTGRYLSAILDQEELLEKVLGSAMEMLGANRGALLLYPEKGPGHMEVKVIKSSAGEAAGSEWFTISESILSAVESKKEAVLFREAFSEEDLNGSNSVFIQEIKSVICAPILNKGEMLGAIYMDNNLVSGVFGEEDLKILEMLSGQAGVSIQNARLYRSLKEYMGKLESSRDEIGRLNQSLEQKVAERTMQLEKANEELKQYAAVAEELAVARERNRVGREMHDTMGHTMTLLVNILETCKIMFGSSPEKAVLKVDEALKMTRVGLSELRASILGLTPQHRREKNLVKDLERLFADSEASGIQVDFTVRGKYPGVHEGLYHVIFRSCQEALTNSIKHGKAKNASIILEFSDRLVKLFIFDDGEGCGHIEKGMGLTGMTRRVEEAGGTIRYGSDGESGFNICIELPVGRA